MAHPPFWVAYPMLQASVMDALFSTLLTSSWAASSRVGVGEAITDTASKASVETMTDNFILTEISVIRCYLRIEVENQGVVRGVK